MALIRGCESACHHYPLRARAAEFHFDLPPELIAQFPTAQRDESRLLVLHRSSRQLEHKKFRDVLDYFRAGDVLVLNNSRVIPTRLRGAAGPLAQERWNQRPDRTNVASNPPDSSGPLQDCGISAPWTKPTAFITGINSGNPSNQEQFSDALEIFRSPDLLLFVLFK